MPYPLAYRWFIHKGLTDWEPWYFCDTPASLQQGPDLNKNAFAARAFAKETGADFEVYLFARRQDREDFAFFVVRNGVIEDKVITVHLSFADKLELRSHLSYEQVTRSFSEWVAEVALADAVEWMSEDDLQD
ncbi:hypothetical protein LOY54_16575 [Pseudomonas sp. B21-032]|uniref:hypothetical protein n=1 Tax=Pseudomonas sp. B21-032 TaxID=2895483 RepID=UPI00215EB3A2|nr:hypothetical protein [Pseudomonas sp. B21-032]UVL59659.1 hypothetical protein LOY54_16575 [Pseudomonas sp. B21-032]